MSAINFVGGTNSTSESDHKHSNMRIINEFSEDINTKVLLYKGKEISASALSIINDNIIQLDKTFSSAKIKEELNKISLTPGPQGNPGVAGAQGPQGIPGPQGDKGSQGNPFVIKKIYTSISSMNSDFSGTDTKFGDMVLINSGIGHEDNAKMFVKSSTEFAFVVNLSGANGIQGPQGIQGVAGQQGPQGLPGAKGAQGIQGIQGIQGLPGARGADGAQGPIGPKGDIGTQGPIGPKGDTGPIGPKGADGITQDLTNYYTKDKVYNKTEIDSKLSSIGTTGFKLVSIPRKSKPFIR